MYVYASELSIGFCLRFSSISQSNTRNSGETVPWAAWQLQPNSAYFGDNGRSWRGRQLPLIGRR